MTSPTIGHLRVDGATLHYEVRGEGPLLLLIPGGTGGAASFDGVADDLATGYTVVSYDPRGLSRSPLDDPEAEQRVAQHADDAFRLLELLSPDAPARVVGCSSGAIVALHLLATHPERVGRVVAHEPPVVEVLPDAAEHRTLLARVRDTFQREGLMPAAAVFAAGLRRPGAGPADADTAAADAPADAPVDAPKPAELPPELPPGLPPEAAARVERTMADMPYFLGRIVPSFMAYTPDVGRLEALSDRLVLAAGADSAGELPYRPAAFLAERFGTPLVHFPGGHTGLSTHPAGFGQRLREVLDA
ncbi:alpha/beta fold hydrolase [Microbispora triticiradicis]|uniref:alpha/beta fold hydrolase n=1 Tax=Microbispora triticiradicis TaxID=2200763 RepID=UPI001AD6B579|nr:alpha/beta hydrolase [Microbispora triticiradicis]MBO4273778.1 alpha/beta fold hydrolase [Microbispora triticiradicis]